MFQAKSLSRKRKQSGHVFHRHSFLLALAMVAMLLAHVPNAANAEAIDGPETKSLQNMKPALAPGSYDLKTARMSGVKAVPSVPSPSPSFARTADLGKATKSTATSLTWLQLLLLVYRTQLLERLQVPTTVGPRNGRPYPNRN